MLAREAMAQTARRPRFVALSARECRVLLRRNHVGRLAFVHGREIDIEPLGYACKGDWLFLRSAPGTKMDALGHNPFVAFEIDEVDGPFDWRSVVVHGTIYELPAGGDRIVRRGHRRAVAAIREITPQALTSGDPVPERAIVYGLHVDRMTGRRSRTSPYRRNRRRARRRRSPSSRRPIPGTREDR